MANSSDLLTFLRKRRSGLAKTMCAPGPDSNQLQTLLEIAARVPDHGKLVPWRFVVLQGDDRGRLDGVFTRAPCVIVVISKAQPHDKIPEWEQVLSAGAVCMNLLTGAQSMGFAAQWLTGIQAYDMEIGKKLGLVLHEKIAGFIYIGTKTQEPTERPRPDLRDIVRYGLV